MMYISTCNHPESPLTGSTAKTMIKRAKKLGMTHFAITDNGYLMSVLQSYDICQKEGIKPIAGVEIYFKDIYVTNAVFYFNNIEVKHDKIYEFEQSDFQ